MFVLGKMPDASDEVSEALSAEQSSHKDLLEVDCLENCLKTLADFTTLPLRISHLIGGS